MANNIKINEGTQTTMASKENSSVQYPLVKLDVGSGTALQDFGGTITAVENLAGGTVDILTAGTVDTVGLRHADIFATVVSSGTSTLGTIKPLVSGSQIFVTDIMVSAGTATNVEVGDGGTSTPIWGTIHLADNGGAVANFNTPIFTTAGSALVYKQSTDGPLTISVQGYVD